MAKPRRRRAGEDGISEYTTQAGPRLLIEYPVLLEDGTNRVVVKRGFLRRADTAAALRAEIRQDGGVGPARRGAMGRLPGRVGRGAAAGGVHALLVPQNIRLHIAPYRGATPLSRLTGTAVDAWMRTLETSGRADGRGGLSARTVRHVHTTLRSALGDAVEHGRLAVNPTDRSTPPSPSEARPPEMQTWTARELGRFLAWAESRDPDLAITRRC